MGGFRFGIMTDGLSMDIIAARKLLNAYMYDPAFIPSRYGLAPLPDLVDSVAVLGATRFMILPSFEPERIYTLLFCRTDVEIESAIGATALWGSLPQYLGVGTEMRLMIANPFHVESVARKRSVLSIGDIPPPLNEWKS